MAYKILVADDEKEIRDLLRLYLEKTVIRCWKRRMDAPPFPYWNRRK